MNSARNNLALFFFFIRMERFLFCTIRKKDLMVLGSLAPTRDQETTEKVPRMA